MRIFDIIKKKRYGEELSKEEIEYFLSGYVDEKIYDYQAAALLMAICINGMTDRETSYLTELMVRSGDTVDLSRFGRLTADKHSTGGVGDKTTLATAPIAASLGCKVAKMSGRGLGHTGGTIDKLESIPGYRTDLSAEEFFAQVQKTGIAVIGQSDGLCPADKKLYALRDVTATIDSIPLIASSVMSKKIAAGSANIVLDVKCGSGAFMKTEKEAVLLAEKMVETGKIFGRKTAALITDMNTPLGSNIGNSLEVIEAVKVIRGEENGELSDVCFALAAEMVSLTFDISSDKADQLVREAVRSGKAFEKMKEWVAAQGGDVSYLEDPSKFRTAAYSADVYAPVSGYVTFTDAEKIGKASVVLGAGRKTKEDVIDHAAGLIIHKKRGDRTEKGEKLCTLFSDDKSTVPEAERLILDAYSFGNEPPEKRDHILKILR